MKPIDSTPIKSDNSVINILHNGTYSNMDPMEVVKLVLTELCDIKTLLVNYQEEVKTLKQKQEIMDNSLKFLNNDVEELQVKVKELTAENAHLKESFASLTTKTDTNTQKISNAEDYSRRMNLEITDIPVEVNEDCAAIAREVFDMVGVSVPEKEISVAHRVKVNSASDKIPSIIIKFRDLFFRNKVLNSRSSNRIRIADMGFSLPTDSKHQYAYINEHLTPEKKHLLYLAKKLKMEKKWSYIGVNDGKIYARKADGTDKIEIHQEKDLAIFHK